METGGPNRRWPDPGNRPPRKRPLPPGITPITLRIPTDIYEQVRAAAWGNRRSINDEVLIAVEDHLAETEPHRRMDQPTHKAG